MHYTQSVQQKPTINRSQQMVYGITKFGLTASMEKRVLMKIRGYNAEDR